MLRYSLPIWEGGAKVPSWRGNTFADGRDEQDVISLLICYLECVRQLSRDTHCYQLSEAWLKTKQGFGKGKLPFIETLTSLSALFHCRTNSKWYLLPVLLLFLNLNFKTWLSSVYSIVLCKHKAWVSSQNLNYFYQVIYFSGKPRRHLEFCSNSVGTHCAEVDVFHESRWFFSATLSQADNWLLWRHLFISGAWRLGINRFGFEYWMSVKTLNS